ncbi:methyltransferase domain-containing protein [Candidatus Pelagibacter sp.]|nr:methyltransferase domain-containing protein [Candidatus Pelagibacter sp.]
MISENLDKWFIENLVCPIDKSNLKILGNHLECSNKKHQYLIYNKIPIMLVDKYIDRKNFFTKKSLLSLESGKLNDKNYIQNQNKYIINEFVQKNIAATNSDFYKHSINNLKKYPIPNFPINSKNLSTLLDIGCGWGRWTISANKNGFSSVGIDPSLNAVIAARNVADQLNIKSKFLVGDALYLPFKENLFDYCYSYSVLQHFEKKEVIKSLKEIKYVLKQNGISYVQMLNKYGLRSLYNQIKRNFREAQDFEARYWTPKELQKNFENYIGYTKIETGSYFTQAQEEDYEIFSFRNKIIFKISLFVKNLSKKLNILQKFADNLFLISNKS